MTHFFCAHARQVTRCMHLIGMTTWWRLNLVTTVSYDSVCLYSVIWLITASMHAMIRHQNALAMFLASTFSRGIHASSPPPLPERSLFWIFSGGWMPLVRTVTQIMAKPRSRPSVRSLFYVIMFVIKLV